MLARTVAVLLVVGVLVVPAPAAGVGRPSSAVVVAPESGASAVLHWHEVEYAELSSLVKPGPDAASKRPRPDTQQLGRSVIVSWLTHDTDVWRVDEIYYEAPDRLWVRTEMRTGTAADHQVDWHRSRDGDRLREVLRGLRVIEVAYVRDVRSAEPTTSAEPSATAGPGGHRAAARPNPWGWAAGGLFTGVLLTLGIGWFGRRSTGRDRVPRQQLIDL